MRDTRDYKVYPSDLDVLNAFSSLLGHMKRCRYKENPRGCDNVGYHIDVDDHHSLRTNDYAEFIDLLSANSHTRKVYAHSHWDTGVAGDLGLIVHLRPASLEVTVESNDRNIIGGVHDLVRQWFGASNPEQRRSKHQRRYESKKSVFLAHRFDEEGTAAATLLAAFLMRLGFDVAEGSGYQARDIPSKVADGISRQDIFMCIATQGDHSWILSEAAYAKSREKYIILLCEEGVDFTPGILGTDYEYLEFPRGLIEKSYTDLLFALPS